MGGRLTGGHVLQEDVYYGRICLKGWGVISLWKTCILGGFVLSKKVGSYSMDYTSPLLKA